MSVWDEPGIAPSGDYVKFDSPGDTVTGKIVGIGIHTWDDGSKSPQLLLDCDGQERSLTAGQVRLKAALAEKRPAIGDTITITFTETEKRPGGKTLKHFTVSVNGGGNAAPAAPAAAPAPSGASDDQIAAAKALLAQQGLA